MQFDNAVWCDESFIYKNLIPMSNTSTPEDSVHITLSEYLSLLSRVNESIQILWDIKEAELEVWRNDTDARLAELTDYVQRRLIQHYNYEYKDYKSSLKAVPLKWWEKLFGFKSLDRESEFNTTLDFAMHELEEVEGGSFDAFYAATLGPAAEMPPWKAVNHVYRNEYNSSARKTNHLDEALASIEREHDLISRSPVALFTLPRSRYNNYLGRVAEAEKAQAERNDHGK